MAYYSKVLLPDEQVRYVGTLHWSIYLRSLFWLILAIAAGIASWRLRADALDQGQTPPVIGAALAVAAAIFALIWLFGLLAAWGRRATTEIVVTDRRIIYKEGFIRRRTLEMNMNKVETVDVIQPIWGRIFNYGTVIIRGVGSSYEPLTRIANPLALRTAIVAQ
jgi:uncharacterized membrane protein YdbT with pleckstrin-like domain